MRSIPNTLEASSPRRDSSLPPPPVIMVRPDLYKTVSRKIPNSADVQSASGARNYVALLQSHLETMHRGTTRLGSVLVSELGSRKIPFMKLPCRPLPNRYRCVAVTLRSPLKLPAPVPHHDGKSSPMRAQKGER